MKFGILRYPHHNRRYHEATRSLLECEFGIVTVAMDMKVTSPAYETMAGLELYTFEVEALSSIAQRALHVLSSNFVLFRVLPDSLIPFNENRATYFQSDISGILKYSGKTNERFTSLMLNVGIFSSDFAREFDSPLTVFDPMCGRGTTLYEGLIAGYHVSGMEIRRNECPEINNYLKRYFKFHRFKHTATTQTIRPDGRKSSTLYTIETANTTEAFKEGDRRRIQFAEGDTRFSHQVFKKNSVHVIASDLPYGVQHKKALNNGDGALASLLGEAAQSWFPLLREGGTVVLAHNTHSITRERLAELFEAGGYRVLTGGHYENFEHWVEQAVRRDLFVAKKVGT
ncbi:hypothetical protein KKF84_02485 [Myxococcota bacterium]|nr:hypothetical protein [Myxococcota bacterium]MBU1534156.1 hypothetical protein [Myxococcota bacterium]